MRIPLIPLALLALSALPAAAQDTGLQSLQTGDDLRGWEAVGRLDFGTDSFCTGTLITPNTVITAAHCLFDKETGRAYDTADVTFLAGLRNGRPEAVRNVARMVAHPSYDPQGDSVPRQVRYDVAVLRLSQPIRHPGIQPLAFATAPSNDPSVGVVSYAQDRADAPSLQERCSVLAVEQGILITSCLVDFGSSGAPIFRFDLGEPRLVSVVSAMAEIEGRDVSLGSDLSQPIAEVLAMLSATSDIDTSNTGARMVRPGDDNQTGALVVRP
ncbi:MAG: trypsin-like serine protease [Pseudomonadota bacterium]